MPALPPHRTSASNPFRRPQSASTKDPSNGMRPEAKNVGRGGVPTEALLAMAKPGPTLRIHLASAIGMLPVTTDTPSAL